MPHFEISVFPGNVIWSHDCPEPPISQLAYRYTETELRTARDELRKSSDALKAAAATISALRNEVEVDDKLIAERDKLLDLIPCPAHGRCVPYAMTWIKEHRSGAITSGCPVGLGVQRHKQTQAETLDLRGRCYCGHSWQGQVGTRGLGHAAQTNGTGPVISTCPLCPLCSELPHD